MHVQHFAYVNYAGNPPGEEPVKPGKKYLRGMSAKERREYERIKESAERSGRYLGQGKRSRGPFGYETAQRKGP